MKKITTFSSILLCALLALSSCDKGYDVRVTNYSTEVMDSVTIGGKKIIYTNIERQTSTNYTKLKKGTYPILCISKSKKHYSSSITIDKTGSGKRSIQIDGTGTISILED